jgi:hypothetical protein
VSQRARSEEPVQRAAKAPAQNIGRPRGKITNDSLERERLAALMEVAGMTQYKMVAPLYPDQHKRVAAEKTAQKFLKRHRQRIDAIKSTVTLKDAQNELKNKGIKI